MAACRCGASTTVTGVPAATARSIVGRWRTEHLCLTGDALNGAQRGGATSGITSAAYPPRVGFGAAPDVTGPYAHHHATTGAPR